MFNCGFYCRQNNKIMTPKQLEDFKIQTAKFYKLVEKLTQDNEWDEPEYICVRVLLQNLAFKGIRCEGYSHNKEVDRVNKKISSVKALSEYYSQNWFIEMVKQELDMIYTGVMYMEILTNS